MTRPILVILPSIITGGAEIQAMMQIRELSRRGVPVRLMVLSDAIDPEVLAGAGLPGEHICRLRNPSPVVGPAFLKMLWRDLGPAAAFARRHDIGPVIAHLPPSHFFARVLFLAMILCGRRLRLFQYHHSEERLLAPLDSLGKRMFFALNQGLSRLCDHAHWHVSRRVLEDISNGEVSSKNAIIDNSCDMDSPGDTVGAEAVLSQIATTSGSKQRLYIVLLPGRLLARKGHILLIGALRRLVEAEGLSPGDIQLVFAGDGALRSEIERVTAEYRFDGYLTLLGAIPHQRLLALYGMVDLVVIPSLIEGFGIVAIEALSRGALVIASDAAGLDDIVRSGENGFQFPVGDEEALFERLRYVWRHHTEPLIDRGSLHAEMEARFGTEAHIDRILVLLGV